MSTPHQEGSPCPKSYSFTELARVTGYSRQFWYKLKYSGQLPTFRMHSKGNERVYHDDVVKLFPESVYFDQQANGS